MSTGRLSSTTIRTLGREYRAYPEIAGTVRFANGWDATHVALMDGWIADMAAIYPSIKVESEDVDGVSTHERLVTALASGRPPNAVMLRSESIAFFAEQGGLLPLDSLMVRDGVTADWFSSSELITRTWHGQTYGLPQTTDGAQHLLFVNLGLMEKVGVDPATSIGTWQDLEALVEPARRSGVFVVDPIKVTAGVTGHQLWTYANGGRYWDDDVKKIGWTEPASVEAAEWMLKLVKAQAGDYARLASPGDPRTALSAEQWAAERYLCCVNDAGWFFQLQQQAPNIRYAAYPFPRNAQNGRSRGETPSVGGWTLAIPKSAREWEAAWEWLKLTAVSESACTFAERQRRPSPLAWCDERAGLSSAHPYRAALSTSLARSVRLPLSPIQPQLEQRARQMQDEILRERRTPAAALESAARDAQRLLDDWQAKEKRG
jgi:multiple sugar transport system substrate-binding protein